MAKKTLLKEATIRRFMKLAELNPLAEGYFDTHAEELEETTPAYQRDDEEEEVELDVDLDVDEPGEDVEAEEEVELDVEEDPEAQDKAQEFIKRTADSMAAAAEEIFGLEVEVETDEEPEEVDVDMGDIDAEGELEAEEPGEEIEVETEEEFAELDEVDLVEDDAVIQEVAARVAKRILALKNR